MSEWLGDHEAIALMRNARKVGEAVAVKARVPTDSKQSWWGTLDSIHAKAVDRAFLFEPLLWPLSELDLQDQYVEQP